MKILECYINGNRRKPNSSRKLFKNFHSDIVISLFNINFVSHIPFDFFGFMHGVDYLLLNNGIIGSSSIREQPALIRANGVVQERGLILLTETLVISL